MKLATVGLGVMLAWTFLEVTLRFAPGVIPPKLLILFEPGLRAEIAAGSFPLEKDYRPIERDDNGPPLRVARPGSLIVSVDNAPEKTPRFADEIGFCNPSGRYEGRDRVDVVAIGDSFTWCHAIRPDQTWPALLEAQSGLATVDLGQGGTGLYEYVQILREFGLAKKPRIVIMNIYGGNDLRDAVEYGRYRAAIEDGEVPPSESPRPIAPALAASVVGRHSYSLNLLLAAGSWLANQGAGDWERIGMDFHYAIDAMDGPIAFNIQNRDRDEIVTARHLEAGTTTPGLWDIPLSRFAALGKEHGFTPVVTYTPSAHTIYAGRVRFSDPSIPPLLERLDDAQRMHLAEGASRFGYEFHDLTPALREAAQNPHASDLLYDPVNMHFTARGHQVTAAAIAGFVSDRAARGVAAN